MHIVTVRKEELTKIVTKNRDGHREIFLKAQEVYRRKVIEELEASLADARCGAKFRTYISLEAPCDHTPDYDRVLAMLEMSVDDEIELTSEEFERYVQDNWRWSQQFLSNVTSYGVSAE